MLAFVFISIKKYCYLISNPQTQSIVLFSFLFENFFCWKIKIISKYSRFFDYQTSKWFMHKNFIKKYSVFNVFQHFILSHLTNSQHTKYLLQLFFFHNQNHKFKQQTKKPSRCRMRVCTTSRFSSIGTVPYGSLLFLMLLKWNYALFNSVAQDKNQHQN